MSHTLMLTSDTLTQLYTMPVNDWITLNKRVGNTNMVKPVAHEIIHHIPHFPQLEVVCNTWMNHTFPQLIAQCEKLFRYSNNSLNDFTNIKIRLAKMSRNRKHIPEELKQNVLNALLSLQSATESLAENDTLLFNEVYSFLVINTIVDAEIATNNEKLGSWWTPFGHILQGLENATALVSGTWQAITNDIQLALSEQINISLSFINDLDIDNALTAWDRIKAATQTFATSATNHQQYWHSFAMAAI